MQTQRDHVHAYQMMIGRMSAGLLLGDTNYGDHPARRAYLGLIWGVVLGLLIGIGFWVYGLINPGGNEGYQTPGAILVEEETGATYIYRGERLIPVRNQASAMLLSGPDSQIITITRASLSELPRGPMVGIPDAPEAVPDQAGMAGQSWLLCLPLAGLDGPGSAADGAARMSINMSPDARAAAVPPDRYAWVMAADGTGYIVWNGFKLPVADDSVPLALGFQPGQAARAPDPWLAALPDGPELGAARFPSAGQERSVDGTAHAVGDLFRRVAGNTEQFYVLLSDGLAPISRTEVALQRARFGTPVTEIDESTLAAERPSSDPAYLRRIPEFLAFQPVLPDHQRTFCLRQRGQDGDVTSQLVRTPRADAARGIGRPHLKPTTGVLAAAAPIPKEGAPVRYLITDRGYKYLLSDDDVVAALKLPDSFRPMAPDVLAAIPSGPALSISAAAGSTAGEQGPPKCGDLSGYAGVALAELPPQAAETRQLIDEGGPFPYPERDGSVFGNREGILPDCPDGHYREYTVPTPGSPDRGERRLVAGQKGELFYTGDHYQSFVLVEASASP